MVVGKVNVSGAVSNQRLHSLHKPLFLQLVLIYSTAEVVVASWVPFATADEPLKATGTAKGSLQQRQQQQQQQQQRAHRSKDLLR